MLLQSSCNWWRCFAVLNADLETSGQLLKGFLEVCSDRDHAKQDDEADG